MKFKLLLPLLFILFFSEAYSENKFDEALKKAYDNVVNSIKKTDKSIKKKFSLKNLNDSLRISKSSIRNSLDTQRFRLGQLVEKSATWADGLFGEIDPESYQNHSYITLGTYYDWSKNGVNEVNIRFRSRVHLPILKKKFKLVVTSTSESLFKEDISGTNDDFNELDNNGNNDNTFTSALGWTLKQTKKLFIDLKVGLKFDIPLEPYVKTQLIRHFKINPTWTFDFEQNLFSIINDETGSTTAFSFSKRLSDNRLVKQRTYGIISDLRDFEWSHGYSYFQNLGSTRAYSISADINGVTEPRFRQESYRVGAHYRQSFFRPWLFLYCSPALIFPRSENWNGVTQVRIGVDAIISTRSL